MDTHELLLTTCRHVQQWSACLWDHSSGNILHCYKNGGVVAPKSVNFVGNDYIVSADDDKPMTHVWLLNSQEPVKKLSTILPESVTVMSVCPKGCYLAAGIGLKLYVWHLSSGKLFTIQRKNFQPITCVKFSSDGVYVIVAGQDGLLVVYDLASLVSFHNNYLSQSDIGQVEPLYTKHDHSLPITDVHVGAFGHKSRVATVSSDSTCKLYTLSTGTLLLSLVFDEPLSSVIFDGPCWNLFVGAHSGKIQQFSLREPPRSSEHHVGGDLVFQGHQKRVSCLDLSLTSGVLVSGSDDNFVFIWEIASRQILRRLEHKGAITNVKCVLNHDHFFNQNFKPKLVMKNLDRDLAQTEEFVVCGVHDDDVELSDEGRSDGEDSCNGVNAENARLRAVNKQLYDVAVQLSRKCHSF
ncbi:hypothetical protein GEV33_007966 [Tenebrio molitor]|uniref:WD repeat-containing protein 18 n=1 Tax=Tenebrio molitor TaxID=7067 RepID=A0A8J6H9Y2_TENMO|nr:hypothetical protein GEV33_007966 [Tenebrio molitor]